MSTYNATILWERDAAQFTDNRYQRTHQWEFDGGKVVHASASPHIVPVPLSDPTAVDPEEAFVASISSCHMLWFLSIAATRGWVIDRYEDRAEGLLEEDAEGRLAITRVTLRPRIIYADSSAAGEKEAEKIHFEAHERCFIANSVKTEISIEPELC